MLYNCEIQRIEKVEKEIQEILLERNLPFLMIHTEYIENIRYQKKLYEAFKRDMKHLKSFFTEKDYANLFSIDKKIQKEKERLRMISDENFFYSKERKNFIKKNLTELKDQYFSFIESCRTKNNNKKIKDIS